MDRTLFWDMNQDRTFDSERALHDVLYSISYAMQDLLGAGFTVVSGLTATQAAPASLSVNLAAGRVMQLAPADAVSEGAIPQDLTQILQQGTAPAQQVTLTTAGLSAGQSRWALIQAQFNQTDSVRVNDPNAGLLYFYNAANPNQPFQGVNNNQQVTPTVRQGLCSIQVVYGSVATTGSEVPPQPSGGWVPLYLIDLTFGQTAVTTSQILKAGPSVGTGVPSNYTAAPFLAGLLQQHHLGTVGQAPQIDLTKEVRNQLPLANLPSAGVAMMSNTQVFTSSGTFTVPAGVTKVWATVVGAGGGGGGTTATNSGQVSVAGGGGGGSMAFNFVSVTPSNGMTVTVGIGGSGGVSGGGNGGTGGASSFASMSSPGGGGAAGVPAAVPPVVQFGSATTSPSSGGLFALGGWWGGNGMCGSNLGNYISGGGGQGPWGGATAGVQNSPGAASGSPGAGGSGASSGASASGFAGGGGANGIVIIQW